MQLIPWRRACVSLVGDGSRKLNLQRWLRKFGCRVNVEKLSLYFTLVSVLKQQSQTWCFLASYIQQQIQLGCFVVTFFRDKKKLNVAKISTVYLNRDYISGSVYADALLDFLQKEIYPVLKTSREELKADFVGRYVWAKSGFQFAEKYWFKDAGCKKETMSLMEMVQRNFERFISKHSIKVNQLKIVRDRKSVLIESIQELKTPADFAAVVHSQGKEIKVAALKDEGSLSKPEPMHVGKAFMLSNYLPEGKMFIRSQGMVNFSVTALPYYNGYRDVFGL
ncbi:MAG: hypothetical protein IT292_03210 [Deltaproteobacteria bacterium]|nr:hypothetical protein [Deltaproteobacteria bacterium]